MSTHYDTLRVPLDATVEVVKARHRLLASRYHPDKYKNGTETFIRVQAAFEELADPRRRKRYDDMLRRQKRMPAKDPCWFCHKSGGKLGYDKKTGSRVHLQCIRDALKRSDPIAELMQYLLQELGQTRRPRCSFCDKADGELVDDHEFGGDAHLQCIRDGIKRGDRIAELMQYLLREHEEKIRRTRPLDGRFHSYWTWPSKRAKGTEEKAIPANACIGVVRFSGLHNYLIWDGTKVDLRKYEITFPDGDVRDFSAESSFQFAGGQLYDIDSSSFRICLDNGQHWTYWRTGDDLWFEFPDQVFFLAP